MDNQSSILYRPAETDRASFLMDQFIKFIESRDQIQFDGDYQKLHRWSVNEAPTFWSSLFDFFDIKYKGLLTPACTDRSFKSYGWFPNVRINFAETLLRQADFQPESTALRFVHESGKSAYYTYQELREEVTALSTFIGRDLKKGEVLAAYMPNIPQTLIAMLATAAKGGIFTSTSCDFGVEGVLDRFSQSRPKVLIAATSYEYNGKVIDLSENLKKIISRLPTLEKVILVDFLDRHHEVPVTGNVYEYKEIFKNKFESLVFEDTGFQDPLYIMYSSGTTGKPKCIVHSIGGTLLQHVKELGLHCDVRSQTKLFFFTTCGWMMWNWLVSGLALGAELILYEGSPSYPSLSEFFEIIDRESIEIFGTSPKFLKALEDSHPKWSSSFPTLKRILSTGAPLMPEQFDFVDQKIKKGIQLASISGGTDILGCFMLGNPLMEVRRGEIQCLGLGMDVAVYDTHQNSVVEQEGELVCQQSFPSRPLYFLNDDDGQLFHKAYFDRFPGIWTHGDFIQLTNRQSVIVYGRSDATLNPGGVRIGTAEIYRQTEKLSYLQDALCVGRPSHGDIEILLFVKMRENENLTESRIEEIKRSIKQGTTSRHVPRQVFRVKDIPYTRSGKKMELAVSRILSQRPLENLEAMTNPDCLDDYRLISDSLMRTT